MNIFYPLRLENMKNRACKQVKLHQTRGKENFNTTNRLNFSSMIFLIQAKITIPTLSAAILFTSKKINRIITNRLHGMQSGKKYEIPSVPNILLVIEHSYSFLTIRLGKCPKHAGSIHYHANIPFTINTNYSTATASLDKFTVNNH